VILNLQIKSSNNNYLFDRKKEKKNFAGFFSSAKNSRFITSAGGGTSYKTDVFSTRTKNKVEERISFFIGHEVLFYETAFSASAVLFTRCDEAATWSRSHQSSSSSSPDNLSKRANY
jgi:hypothetical protein